jgi:hypothetical protein
MKANFAKLLLSTLIVLMFSSNANLLYAQNEFYNINQIQEIRINFYESNWREILDSLFINYGEEGRLVCDVVVNGTAYPKAGIRFKGFSSYDVNRIKNPFNIDLDYTYKHQNYQGYTKLKLGNVIYDPSFVRETVSYKIAQKYMPASQANFAKLYINGVYVGLYTSVEAVDDNYTQKFFKSTGNSFFKGSPAELQYPFGQNANLAYTHGVDSSGYMPYYKLESKYYGWNDLFNLIYTLTNDTARISEILNVDRALWMHAFNYALLNLDSYIGYSQNYYLYMDNNGRFNTIPWDLNMSFGGFRNTDGISLSLTIDKTAKLDPLQHLLFTSYTPRPLMKKLFVVPQYRKMYIAHLRTIVKENLENNAYFDMATEYQTVIDSAVLNDTNKFYSYADFKNNLTVDAGPTSGKIPGLKSLIDARIAYLSTYTGFTGYPVIANIKHDPDVVEQNSSVWITAQVSSVSDVQLNYRNSSKAIFSTTTMFDDGNHNDGTAGDGTFGAQILANGKTLQYYIWAENDSAGSFSPERAQYEFYSIQPQAVQGDIVINEIKLNSNSASTFEQGSWLELFNNTNEDITLTNVYLASDNLNLLHWKLPDTTICSKSYFMVGLDNPQAQDSVNTPFSISQNDGSLYLTYQNGHQIDAISYSQIPINQSIGRYPNGKGLFSLMNPTYAHYNSIPISERVSFSVFPNPTQQLLNFEINAQKSFITFEIFNALLQPIYKKQIDFNTNGTLYNGSIDLSAYAKGVYLLKVTWDDHSEIKKIIKQ